MIFYLDESGDLGFDFSKPYCHGGSSRYLTIAAVEIPKNFSYLTADVVNRMYCLYKWNNEKERKASDLAASQKRLFAAETHKLIKSAKCKINIHAITVKKENVRDHIRTDPNKLYNYMVQLLLLESMSQYPQVTVAHDQRSIKVKSGNSMEDYLQIALWFEKKVTTIVKTHPIDSHKNRNILFVDYLTHICWSRYEFNTDFWSPLPPDLKNKRLFFSP